MSKGEGADFSTPDSNAAQMASVETTDSQATIEKGGGESIVSFDELESVENFQKSELKAEAQKAVEVDKLKEKLKGKDSDQDTKETETNIEDAKEDKESQEQEVVQEGEVATFEAKSGDKVVDVPEDLQVPVTIDGKQEFISVSDLRNHYSGKVVWDRKFEELAKERNAFEAEYDQINQAIEDIVQTTNGNILDGFKAFSEYMGFDPVEVHQKIIEAYEPLALELAQMTDEQKEIHKLKLQNEYRAQQLERARSEDSRRASQEKIVSDVRQLSEQYNLDIETMNKTFSDLVSLQNEGEIEDGGITASLVAETADWNRAYDKVEAAAEKVMPNLLQNEAVIDRIATLVRGNRGLTTDDVADIIQDAYGDGKQLEPVSEALSKKAEEASKGPRSTSGVEAGSRNPQNEDFISFDQL